MTQSIKPQSKTLFSPNGALSVTITLDEQGKLFFRAEREGRELLGQSPLGVKTSLADFTTELTFISASSATICEDYKLTTGKQLRQHAHAEEMTLRFGRKHFFFDLIVRAYDEGFAFCYGFSGKGSLSVVNEATAFALPKDGEFYAQDFVCHYEGYYNRADHAALLEGRFGMPLLMLRGEDALLLSEAGVYGHYCSSNLLGDRESGLLKLAFAPDGGTAVVSQLPFRTPWRAAAVGSLADVVETGLFEHLNPPSELTDVSWIKPGRSAWSWWSGDSTTEYETAARYVDFAAKMGWEYYLCDAGWQKSWIERLVAYGKERSVGITVWFHYRGLETEEALLENLPWLASIGVKGIKVDFFESDSQDRIRLYDRIAELCAELKLLVVYHGCTKPSGERRRWPHVMTREGIFGAEYYIIPDKTGPSAEHNCTVPFTRNVVGGMDYTPVTVSKNGGSTTWAHQLALGVVFESGIQHYADQPEWYEKFGEALEFLKKCPCVWDETKLLDGAPGRSVALARRSGDDWFAGFLCAKEAAGEKTVSLSFLQEGKRYRADLYEDGGAPDQIKHRSLEVTAGDSVKVFLAQNGGAALSLTAL